MESDDLLRTAQDPFVRKQKHTHTNTHTWLSFDRVEYYSECRVTFLFRFSNVSAFGWWKVFGFRPCMYQRSTFSAWFQSSTKLSLNIINNNHYNSFIPSLPELSWTWKDGFGRMCTGLLSIIIMHSSQFYFLHWRGSVFVDIFSHLSIRLQMVHWSSYPSTALVCKSWWVTSSEVSWVLAISTTVFLLIYLFHRVPLSSAQNFFEGVKAWRWI